MKYLYLYLNIGSFLIPFLFSFHPKLKFYRKWKSLFPAIAIMMGVFITWDIIFTQQGIWGFNEAYVSGLYLFNLPIEEWLFFICIPYACIFTHYALQYFFPKFSFSEKTTNVIYISLLTLLILTLWYTYDRWYTLINFSYTILLLGWVYNTNRKLLSSFFPTFIVILLPFFIVNGILTGSGPEAPVVWYNDAENLGIRIVTIPIEDTMYALSMLLTVLVFTEKFEKKKRVVV
ncbi:lycopene cyclase domain-containing protein [Ulvibacter sp. MAR_2010_11]|uniref:lycopene cyclase domain-containing protein n=1 Tax=Ulvibacter sp. MAR_2010_11 TaxID=1250229 RepID=UPI000C2CA66E|nr:lycopene cyclase domain-containing protein [Ulvibacter sp. MAR_2010_11]PKA81958.1 lycopene cyclase domain-containing protein [Ulvibacter sp. MAR_2010_11]